MAQNELVKKLLEQEGYKVNILTVSTKGDRDRKSSVTALGGNGPFVRDVEKALLSGEADIAAFAEGLVLRDGTECLPAKLEPLGPGESLITVCEGKYHQVRRMMAARQMTVNYLRREREGSLELGNLPLGQVRELTAEETAALL